MSKTSILIIFIAAVLIFLGIGYYTHQIQQMPRFLEVPEKYKTIQSAIDKARPRDTVFIKAGTYEEKIRFKEGINVIGAGIGETVIRGAGGVDPVIVAENCKSGKIFGLSIKGGKHDSNTYLPSGAINLSSSFIELANCSVKNSSTYGICLPAFFPKITTEISR